MLRPWQYEFLLFQGNEEVCGYPGKNTVVQNNQSWVLAKLDFTKYIEFEVVSVSNQKFHKILSLENFMDFMKSSINIVDPLDSPQLELT